MKDGICPKCGGDDIRMGHHWSCRRDHLVVNNWGLLPAQVINYVCASCGYLENYVRESDLQTLTKNWQRVGPAGKAKPKPVAATDRDGWER
jgi:hypothetical protein